MSRKPIKGFDAQPCPDAVLPCSHTHTTVHTPHGLIAEKVIF